jgi:hypothetical protein
MSSQVNYELQPFEKIKKVFFTGSTAVTQGYGVCYDKDYDDGTDDADAVDAWGKRDKAVAAPTTTNNNAFAGVAVRSYTAVTGGQWIDIYEPGSNCLVYIVDNSATIGENNYVTCLGGSSANAGKFTATPLPFMGKGVARVMQTLTEAGLALAELIDGEESGLVEIIPTATLTAGGAITCMIGGVTFFDGAATPLTDCTFTFIQSKPIIIVLSYLRIANMYNVFFTPFFRNNSVILVFQFISDVSALYFFFMCNHPNQ